MAAPFRVWAGGEDEPIASGTVRGGAVILDLGTYRVEVQSDTPISFEDVILGGSESVSLELPIESD